MKIAMVSEHANPLAALGEVDSGGQNLHVAELSAALHRRGHEVTVYTRQDEPDTQGEVIAQNGYRIIHVPAGPIRPLPKDDLLPFMTDFAHFLKHQWSDDEPDVVHAHFWMSGLASATAAKSAGLPVVQTFHALGVTKRRYQGEVDTSPADRIDIERRVGREVARIAATCSDEVFELLRMGIPRSRISVVPCGVNLDQFTPHGSRAVKGRPYRLVTVGRLVPRKGYSTIIDALPALPDTELVLAGGPEGSKLAEDAEAQRLRDQAERRGVADRVHMLGQISHDDMPALLRSADVVVCTPWYEPFGIVSLEAMACGVPVVAAAVGGLTDTVVDGLTGVLVKPQDPRALADSLNQLLPNPALRQSLGSAGRDRASSRYSWDRIAGDIVRVYERAGAAEKTATQTNAGGR